MKVYIMNNTLLIHNDNVSDIESFTHEIKFQPTFSDLDKYISLDIIEKQLKSKEFDIVYIKDNLSSNYLDLYGLRVAYHIRLSEDLGDKRYVPIVILSDIDSYALNKISSLSKILFTKNIYLIDNCQNEIEKFQNKSLKNITSEEYQEKFLDYIMIESPQDTDHHDITNEWAIHQWSDALQVSSEAIKTNNQKISSMLYFKYLKALLTTNDTDKKIYEITQSKKRGKILYIDDEWNKGWSSILNALFQRSKDIELITFEHNYKDANQAILIPMIKGQVIKHDPDVVILDLRLVTDDHNGKDTLDKLTGIQLTEKIKEINPGIQVIMMTASRQSMILEKLYDFGILGYVKKEHPDDMSIGTVENIDKLFTLVENGLERKYLKDMFITKSKIQNILHEDIFAQYISDKEKYEPFWIQLQVETTQVFDILSNSDSTNKFKYAMVSIASSMEAILSIFIIEPRDSDNKYWDGEKM